MKNNPFKKIRSIKGTDYFGLQKRGKYNNARVESCGQKFDSKRELKRYTDLVMMQAAGSIRELQRQVKYELIKKQDGERAVYYIADFQYQEQMSDGSWNQVIEDVKSPATRSNPVYIIKRKLMLAIHGIRIREVM